MNYGFINLPNGSNQVPILVSMDKNELISNFNDAFSLPKAEDLSEAKTIQIPDFKGKHNWSELL